MIRSKLRLMLELHNCNLEFRLQNYHIIMALQLRSPLDVSFIKCIIIFGCLVKNL